jgi:hypothetical protein
MSDTATFTDLNLKLAVIQVLMYDRATLTPRFDVYDFVQIYEGREIDIEEEGYEIIPEVRAYFENLPLPTAALAAIETLEQDGGDEIYLQLCPLWDGEDDRFNIRSAEDAALLPNLRAVTLFYDDDDRILRDFRARGIDAAWL